MKRVFLFVCFMSMLGIPAAVLSASTGFEPGSDSPQSKPDKENKQNQENEDKDKDKDKDKSAPAPPMLVLLGAAAAVAGASRLWLTRSRV